MDAWRVYYAAKRHKYLVLLSVMVATAGAVIVSLFLPKYYVASATLLPSETVIRQSAPNPADASGGASQVEASPRESRVANLLVMAKSRIIADRVARRVHISPVLLMRAVNCDRVMRPESGVATDMISISTRMANPSSAVEIANVWAEEFAKFHGEVSRREAVATREFLDRLMGKSKMQLDQAASDLAAFRAEHLISDLPAQVAASFSELTPLRTERAELQARVAELAARLAIRSAQVRIASPTTSVSTMEPPMATIEYLRQSIGAAKAELVKLSQTYTDDYYRIRMLKQQIAGAQAELDKQQRRTESVVRVIVDPSYDKVTGEAKDLATDLRAGKARIARLDGLISEQEARMSGYSGIDLQLAALKRSYDEAEKAYVAAVAQVHSARIGERLASEAGAIRTVDPARDADGPLRAGPSTVQLVLSAILLGLVVGLGIVVSVETLDTRVRSASDAAELLELPVTGIIPRIEPDGAPRLPSALITQSLPMSPFAESYRFLATEIMLDGRSCHPRSIMVATAKPNQGGTSTICNLAITLAQAGKRVVLVDADLRRPSLHKLFAVGNELGLADLLRNGASARKCLQVTEVENLALITAGSSIDNPWAMLRGARLRELIDDLKSTADYVLVDVPSAIVFADAATVASVVDGVIVVVRANESPRGSEFQIKGLLNRANPNMIGVVLNDVPPSDVDSCHYYAQYYAASSPMRMRPRGASEQQQDELAWTGGSAEGGAEAGELDDEGRS